MAELSQLGERVVAQHPQEYLVNHGSAGEFGRFQTAAPLTCARGERVVIEGQRGLELGVVLCPAGPRHAHLLKDAPVGQLLRVATTEDESTAERMHGRSQAVYDEGCRLAGELGLPLALLDVEVSLDGRHGVIHYLGPPTADIDQFAASLARRQDLFVFMHNLAGPVEEPQEGCGEPNCGRASGGSCTECGSGGGCATGCGTGKADMKDFFAHLRTKMEKRSLTPLL
jgi:hypothetical protein